MDDLLQLSEAQLPVGATGAVFPRSAARFDNRWETKQTQWICFSKRHSATVPCQFEQVWKVVIDLQTSSSSLRLGLEKMLGFEHPIRASPGFNMAAPSG